MNQAELNRIAIGYIEMQSVEVARKIDSVLRDDLLKRSESLNGPVIHHIHNLAIYHSLVKLNGIFRIDDESDEAVNEYCELAYSLKPKFIELTETLKDFQPARNPEDNHG